MTEAATIGAGARFESISDATLDRLANIDPNTVATVLHLMLVVGKKDSLDERISNGEATPEEVQEAKKIERAFSEVRAIVGDDVWDGLMKVMNSPSGDGKGKPKMEALLYNAPRYGKDAYKPGESSDSALPGDGDASSATAWEKAEKFARLATGESYVNRDDAYVARRLVDKLFAAAAKGQTTGTIEIPVCKKRITDGAWSHFIDNMNAAGITAQDTRIADAQAERLGIYTYGVEYKF